MIILKGMIRIWSVRGAIRRRYRLRSRGIQLISSLSKLRAPASSTTPAVLTPLSVPHHCSIAREEIRRWDGSNGRIQHAGDQIIYIPMTGQTKGGVTMDFNRRSWKTQYDKKC